MGMFDYFIERVLVHEGGYVSSSDVACSSVFP